MLTVAATIRMKKTLTTVLILAPFFLLVVARVEESHPLASLLGTVLVSVGLAMALTTIWVRTASKQTLNDTLITGGILFVLSSVGSLGLNSVLRASLSGFTLDYAFAWMGFVQGSIASVVDGAIAVSVTDPADAVSERVRRGRGKDLHG